MNTKHITILHSNDIHADFAPRKDAKTGKQTGGIAYLSGYVRKERDANPDSILYVFSGDMFTGSLIDVITEGKCTIEIMKQLEPDIATIGNHEFDHRTANLYYYKDICGFPIICANLIDVNTNEPFVLPYQIKEVAGVRILFIGVVTEEIMSKKSKDHMLDVNVTWIEPEEAIRRVIKQVENDKIEVDMTIILSHLGIERDRALAWKISKDVKVDMIIGGHSHTITDKPEKVQGIRIVQAGNNTTQIGRCEIDFDLDKKCIVHCDGGAVPIEEGKYEPDRGIEEDIKKYQKQLKPYYNVLTRIVETDDEGNEKPSDAKNETRYAGTEVGNLICDALKRHYGLDAVIIGSGSLRKEKMPSEVTNAAVMEMYAYNDEELFRVNLTGKELKTAMETMLKNAAAESHLKENERHSEFFQISEGFYFKFSKAEEKLVEATYQKKDIDDEQMFAVGIEIYHLKEAEKHLGLDNMDEIQKRVENGAGKRRKASSTQKALKEYMMERFYTKETIKICKEERVVIDK